MAVFEKYKGDDGGLATRRNATLEDAASRLQKDLPRSKPQSPITAKQIASKLDAVAKRHIGGRGAMNKLIADGVTNFDRDVLSRDNLYTAEQIDVWPPSPLRELASPTSRVMETPIAEDERDL